jgi:hypothetical protein
MPADAPALPTGCRAAAASVTHLESHLTHLLRAQITMASRCPTAAPLFVYAPLPRLMQVLAACQPPYTHAHPLLRVAVRLLKAVIVVPSSQNSYNCVQRNGITLVLQLIALVFKSAPVATAVTAASEDDNANVALLTQLVVVLHTLITTGRVAGDVAGLCSTLDTAINANPMLAAAFFPLLAALLHRDTAAHRPVLAAAALRHILSD